jgi:hypothetical protein
MKTPVNIVIAVGLALGGVFGLVGTLLTERNLQAASWAIDGVGLVAATALLTLKFFRKEREVVAAGFLVFAIGESVMLIGTAAPLTESGPSFAAGTALWSCALRLTSVPKESSCPFHPMIATTFMTFALYPHVQCGREARSREWKDATETFGRY